ncbi:MAG: hypothetical protein HQK96_11325 [Nitrospirae bacterium]|nr:hypothetical protein [Nitrospirota bacterium]
MSESLPFLWSRDFLSSANIGKGWIEKNGDLVWTTGEEMSMFRIPLKITKPLGSSVFPRDYNALWIEYIDLNPHNPCIISIDLDLKRPTSVTLHSDAQRVNHVVAHGGDVDLKPVEIVEATTSTWREQDKIYEFKRMFGLSFDKDWRFVQDHEYTVIKRRFHNNISAIEALDIEFSNDYEIGGVNMRLAFKDRPKPDTTVDWDNLPKDIIELDNSTIVRIWIGRYIRNNLANEANVFLEEILVHVKGQTSQVVRDKPLRMVVFQNIKDDMSAINDETENHKNINKTIKTKENIKIIPLYQIQTEESDTGLKMIDIDIEELSNLYANDDESVFKKAVLSVRPTDPLEYCGIRLEGIWAMNITKDRRPVVLSVIDNASKDFGWPFIDVASDNGRIEVLKFYNYYSFNKSITSNSAAKLTANNKLLYNRRDVRIIAKHITTSVIDNELFVKGDTDKLIEIVWPIDTIVEDGTRFFLRLTSGNEFVKYGFISITSGRGQQFKRTFEPNKPLNLTGIKGAISEIRLTMALSDGQFAIKLNNMALFRPIPLSPAEALKIPSPVSVVENLYPIINKSGLIKASPGNLKGIIWSSDYHGDFQWFTRIDNRTGVRGVHFDFENSRNVNEENPCWLSLTFNGKHQQVSKDFCSGLQYGQTYISIPDMFADGGADKLQSITWKLNVGKQITSNTHPLSFNYQMSIDRLTVQPMSAYMLNTALLSFDSKNLYPKDTTADFANGLLSGGAWLNMGTVESYNLGRDLKVLENPYLNVMSVVAERVLLPGQYYMPEFDTQKKIHISPLAGRLVRIGLIVFISVVLVLGWRKGLWQRLWQKIKLLLTTGYCWMLRQIKWPKLLHVSVSKMIFWIIIAVVLYLMGLLSGKIGMGTDVFFTLGALFGFMALRTMLCLTRPMIIRHWSAASEKTYEEWGTVYVLGFVVSIMGCAIMEASKNEGAAGQLAVMAYYNLASGIAQKVLQMCKEGKAASGD